MHSVGQTDCRNILMEQKKNFRAEKKTCKHMYEKTLTINYFTPRTNLEISTSTGQCNLS